MVRRAVISVVLSACGYDWSVVPRPDASVDATVDATADASTPCTSIKGQCPHDSFCEFPDRLCGAGAPGTCRPVPPITSCDDAGKEIVCGCDGIVDVTRCDVRANGFDLSKNNTACKPKSATATRCGFLFCDDGTRCVELDGGVDFRCAP